jgi:autotransporter-associated beta strand protein
MMTMKTKNMTIRTIQPVKSVRMYTIISALASLLATMAVEGQSTETWDNGSGNSLWDTSSVNWSGSTWTDGNSAVFGSGASPITVVGTRTLSSVAGGINLEITTTGTGFAFTNGVLNVTNYDNGTTAWAFNTGVGSPAFYSALTFTLSGSGLFKKEGGAAGAGEWFYGGVTGNGDTNNGSVFNITGTSGVGNFFESSMNLTNVRLQASTGSGVYIGNGTNYLVGQGTNLANVKCGLDVNGGSHVYYGWSYGGGPPYTTMSELLVEFGTSGSYIQTNGTMIVLGDAGAGGGVPYPQVIQFGCNGGSGQTALLELDGGLLNALGIGRDTNYVFPGTGTIKFNGGIFQCRGDNTNLFDVGANAASSILIGQSTSGGGIGIGLTNGLAIDTAGYSVTDLQPLLAGTTSGGLLKLGAGTLDLAGANTYTGPTTVSNGTLWVDGSLVAGSAVEAASGGTIGGSGTINGPVTVDADGTVAPGNSTLGTLTVNNDLTLSSGAGAGFRLNTANSPETNDSLVVTGTQSIGGSTLTVVNDGPALQVGDSFTLLSQPTAGFTTVNLPPGYTWANNLASDGSIQVTAVVTPAPTNITYSVSGNQLVLDWPAGLGWQLQAQTNDLTTGLSTNWVNVTGATPPYTNTINPANATVFYRLVNP